MSDDQPKTTTADPASDELAVSYAGPAPLSNRFIVSIVGQIARVAFLEVTPENQAAHFRAAATLSLNDLDSLQQTLQQIIVVHTGRSTDG